MVGIGVAYTPDDGLVGVCVRINGPGAADEAKKKNNEELHFESESRKKKTLNRLNRRLKHR